MPANHLRLKHIRGLASPKAKPGAPTSAAVPHFERHDYCQHNHPDKVYMGCMTDKKMKQAKDILKKEELRNSKAKLAQIICQKLYMKFRGVPKADIRHLVHKFVANKSQQINANDLTELENEVRALIQNRKRAKEQTVNLPDMNSNPEVDDNKEGGVFGKTGNAHLDSSQGVLPKGREWEALNMFQAYQAGIKDVRDKEEQKRKQQELRAALDAQVLELRMRQDAEKNDDREYLKHVSKDLKRYNDERQAKLDEENAKHALQKSFWEKQMKEDNARHQREKEALIRQEQNDLKRMQRMLAEEQRQIQAKKDQQARMHQAILEENAKNKELHQARLMQERDEDNRVMKEYADRLDAEEKRRQDAFAKRMSDLEKIVQIADDGPVGKGRRDQEKREEELLLKQQLAKDEADARRERDDWNAKMERNRVMAAHNKQLLEEQERAKQAAREKEMIHFERYKRANSEYQAEVIRNKQAEYDKCLRQRKVLQDQIDSKRRQEEDMNAVERSINHDTIDGIRKDSAFQGRLQHRIRMARGGNGSRPNTPGSARPVAKKNGWM